jgi:hypothetical protein
MEEKASVPKMMEFLPNKRKKKDDLFFGSYMPL